MNTQKLLSKTFVMESVSSLMFLYSLISFSFYLKSSLAIDFIASGQILRDNETLVSPNGVFELGFFRTSKRENMYLGLWYKKTPLQRVWVANRNSPINGSYGVLTITADGNIALLDQSSSTVWSSNISSSVPENSLTLQLLDSGNLVLRENTSTVSYLWQSFDHPSDTLLAGMKISWNVETGQERFLTSWKDVDDPSSGDFIYKIDKTILPQIVFLSGSARKFRTGPWDGVRFMGVSSKRSLVHTILMNFDGQEYSYMFEVKSEEVFATVITATHFGSLQRLTLNDSTSASWSVLYSVPNEPCNIYEKCGPNSVCSASKGTTCECLQGFVPKSSDEWNEYRWNGGCVRKAELECNSKDRFRRISGVRFPDLTSRDKVNKSMSLEECRAECLKTCSCSAYANSDIRSGGSGCLMWFGDLVDLKEFIPEENDQDLFIRLAPTEFESRNKLPKKIKILIVAVAIISSASILGFAVWCIHSKRETKRRDLAKKKAWIDLPFFDFATIATATKNFSENNILGQGGFGPVYKGILSTGQEVAVKRLSKESRQGIDEFKSEALLVAKLQHRNLVALLGCCIQGEERMLVYEYMSNKSLNHFVFDRNRSESLDWDTRYRIIMGVARGLLYLHQDSKLQIIHRDLKASNILLDSDMNPKISDFGLARIFGGDETETKTKKVIGTYGYMSPEYAVDGKFSVKSDVFSFGVVLLEIISGTRNRGFSHAHHHHNLLGHAWILWNKGEALEFVDSSLVNSYVESRVLRCIQVGLLCVQKFPLDRPTMVSVVLMLANDETRLPLPNEPAFFVERSSVGVKPTPTKEVSCAVFDDTTILFHEGR